MDIVRCVTMIKGEVLFIYFCDEGLMETYGYLCIRKSTAGLYLHKCKGGDDYSYTLSHGVTAGNHNKVSTFTFYTNTSCNNINFIMIAEESRLVWKSLVKRGWDIKP
jgi:hypothetical protein